VSPQSGRSGKLRAAYGEYDSPSNALLRLDGVGAGSKAKLEPAIANMKMVIISLIEKLITVDLFVDTELLRVFFIFHLQFKVERVTCDFCIFFNY
jgi:hypothetical protein